MFKMLCQDWGLNLIRWYVANNSFNIILYNSNNIIGMLYVIRRSNKQGILDLFIRKKYRCRWMNKYLYFNLKGIFIEICKLFKYDVIITKVNNQKSLRLLNYFKFEKYNDKFYYLRIL